MTAQLLLAIAITALATYFLTDSLGLIPQARRYRRFRPNKDIGRQLDAVMAASFNKNKLLNYSEYNVFKIIEADIAKEGRGYRVFAQTSLGEILASCDGDAFHSINSKRVDILVVDQGGWPALAVEYQGEGHYQGTALGRDAVKKEALTKAGIGYVEVFPADTAPQIRTRIRGMLGWTAPRPRHFGRLSDIASAAPAVSSDAEHAATGLVHPSISSSM
jgi:hypothetical protein